jgi:hypothetical protein
MSLAIYSLVILTATGWTLSITTCMFLLAWQLLTENGWEHYNRKQLLEKTVRNIQPVKACTGFWGSGVVIDGIKRTSQIHQKGPKTFVILFIHLSSMFNGVNWREITVFLHVQQVACLLVLPLISNLLHPYPTNIYIELTNSITA